MEGTVLDLVDFVKDDFDSAVLNQVTLDLDFPLCFLSQDLSLGTHLDFKGLNDVEEKVVSLVKISDGNQALLGLYVVLVEDTSRLLFNLLVKIDSLKNQRQNLVSGFESAESEVYHFVEDLVNQNEVLPHGVFREDSAKVLQHVFYSEQSADEGHLVLVGQAGNHQVNRLSL